MIKLTACVQQISSLRTDEGSVLRYEMTYKLKKMFTKKDIVTHLKEIAGEIRETGIHLRKVVLYGSYAKNKQTKYSDIDVALVADEFSGVPAEDVKLFLKAMRKHYMVQPQTYNTKDFTPEKDPFVEEILRTGIEINA